MINTGKIFFYTVIFSIFLYGLSCSESKKPDIYIINIIQDTISIDVLLRLSEGDLAAVKTDLIIKTLNDSISNEWFLKHVKLTMQDIATLYIKLFIKDYQGIVNKTLIKNTHTTLDNQGLGHDKIFPMLQIMNTRRIKVNISAKETKKDFYFYTKKMYE